MDKNSQEVLNAFQILLEELGGNNIYNRMILEIILEEILSPKGLSPKGKNGDNN